MSKILIIIVICGYINEQVPDLISNNYTKKEYRVPMRDGKTLFTSVYTPKDTSRTYPIILIRTPYSLAPYGEEKFPESIGPNKYFADEKYIFVYQDVRGRFMSEGNFVNMVSHIANKKNKNQTDNSSDTWDTVEWLIENIKHHNGKVGLWGISYPGFNVSSGIINTHPAIKCASPQAPIGDWFKGDDMHHNGAFALLMTYNFFEIFGQKRDSLTTDWPLLKKYPSCDAYNFFLNIGPLKEVKEKYFINNVDFWDSIILHPNNDEFWQQKNIIPHLNNINTAVMTVGGWYDGEDLYGSIHTYQSIEKNNPGIHNIFVMGPWIHGGWSRTKGDSLGAISFGSQTSEYFMEEVEIPFFNHYLKNEEKPELPEALIFETGTNKWNHFNAWPPEKSILKTLYFFDSGKLDFKKPNSKSKKFNEFISDPNKPVPYTASFHPSNVFYNKSYMVEDQRFASSRPDVLCYKTDILTKDITIAGPIQVEMYVSTTGTDADWIVKVIDVFPDTIRNNRIRHTKLDMAGYQMLVRGEILRGKFRNSLDHPEQFTPGKIEYISYTLPDVCHTFKKGHKIMVQVQGSWFPLYDRNPGKYMNIYKAEPGDYKKTINRIYFSKKYLSGIVVRILE